ncbi:hypothetical protein HMPREF1032_03174 [Subdoligranulum sp. 4_3_54A2FAA]|nr:hypothetical protein HMPREF1032_03174 [Subdoligranulum sp. 4_3_54A2FAA]
MTDKELWERLHKNAEWARCNEWETPLCLADDLTAAADAIERLKSELTQEKIDNTNLIGELATVAAERDRYKAERENPQPSTNADRIRAMDDNDMAKLLCCTGWKMIEQKECLEWLQQPAEEADHESNSEP